MFYVKTGFGSKLPSKGRYAIKHVSTRWMIHREEWVLNIFIQHQYPVLTDTYKNKTKQKYNYLQAINKRTYKK